MTSVKIDWYHALEWLARQLNRPIRIIRLCGKMGYQCVDTYEDDSDDEIVLHLTTSVLDPRTYCPRKSVRKKLLNKSLTAFPSPEPSTLAPVREETDLRYDGDPPDPPSRLPPNVDPSDDEETRMKSPIIDGDDDLDSDISEDPLEQLEEMGADILRIECQRRREKRYLCDDLSTRGHAGSVRVTR